MTNITFLTLEKYKNSAKYEFVETNIYKDLEDLEDTNYRIAISFTLEEGEDNQYPLEDILDKYYLYVSEFLSSESENVTNVELAGELNDISNANLMLGKSIKK